MTAFSIPKVLTAKDWASKKGLFAKMTVDTGIGAALTKMEADYAKIPWDILNPDQALTHSQELQTTKVLEALMKKAEANVSKVEAFRHADVVALIKLLEKTETAFKKNRLIPAASAKHVTTMANAAKTWSSELENVHLAWRTKHGELAAKEDRIRDIALSVLKPYFSRIRDDAKQLKADPRVANYDLRGTVGFHQGVRGLSAALARSNVPALLAWKDQKWNPMAQDAFKPTKDSEVVPKVNQVLGLLAELERMIG
jgi:hypothetical protein